MHIEVLWLYGRAEEGIAFKAINATEKANRQWGKMPWESRAVVLLNKVYLLIGGYLQMLNAATMLNMRSTPNHADIRIPRVIINMVCDCRTFETEGT